MLLYELLSGQHPAGADAEVAGGVRQGDRRHRAAAAVRGGSRATTPRMRRRSPRSAPRRRIGCAALLRGDLDTIVGKALKKNPAERYASVAEFADDLRRYLDHQPIGARPDTRQLSRREVRAAAPAQPGRGRGRRPSCWSALIGFYTVRLADRARSRAAPGREGVEGQRAADRPADRRRSVPDAGRQGADRPEPARRRRRAHRQASSAISRSCRPRCSR